MKVHKHFLDTHKVPGCLGGVGAQTRVCLVGQWSVDKHRDQQDGGEHNKGKCHFTFDQMRHGLNHFPLYCRIFFM